MRWVWLFATMPGCLWLGAAEHDERKRAIDPGFTLLDLTPDTWSACAGPPTFTVVGTVSPHHAGRTFDTWFEVDGKRSNAGKTTAEPDGSVLFEVAPGDLAPGCTDSCPVSFVVGVSHLGFDDQADVTATILGETDPQIAQTALVSVDGAIADLATTPLDDNPTGSLQQADWPTLAMGIVDPYLFDPGADLLVSFVLCPEGLSPATNMGDCVSVDAVRSETVLSGDVVYEAPTEAFAAAACDPANVGMPWEPYLVLENHPCASSGLIEGGTAFRLVLPDCDGDGYTVDYGDCDDDDPTISPGAVEVWYDGIDQDCAGDDDFDRDGDGVEGGKTGDDCDDNDPLTYPKAPEICDDSDNDCDGYQLVGVVTVESGAGTSQHKTLEDAIGAAGAGDTLRVCPGTFVGDHTITMDLTIIGSGPDQSIIQPSGPGTVIDIIGPRSVTIEGLEITGGTDPTGTLRGGGVRAPSVSSLSLTDVRVTGNEADDGAGILLGTQNDTDVITLVRVDITNNIASNYGGGLYIERDVLVEATDLVVQNNDAREGGGVAVGGWSVLDLTSGGGLISMNTASSGGGVLLLDDAEIHGGEVLANDAVTGAGIRAHLDEDTINMRTGIYGTRIANHTANGIVRGAGIYAESDVLELTIRDAIIENNHASDEGGGLLFESLGIAGGFADIADTTIRDNSAGGDGGGVYFYNVFPVAQRTTISDNVANRGGGVFGDTFFGLWEADFDGNTATAEGGGFYGATYGEIWNYYDAATFTNNTAGTDGGGLYLDNTWFVGPDIVISGNTAGGDGGGVFMLNVGHMGIYGTGNISGNTSGTGSSDGAFVAFGAESMVSCPTVIWSDTVGCSATPAAGVPANNCFSLYPSGLDDGQCDICP